MKADIEKDTLDMIVWAYMLGQNNCKLKDIAAILRMILDEDPEMKSDHIYELQGMYDDLCVIIKTMNP